MNFLYAPNKIPYLGIQLSSMQFSSVHDVSAFQSLWCNSCARFHLLYKSKMQQVHRSSAVAVMHLATISASKLSWHIGWLIGRNRWSSFFCSCVTFSEHACVIRIPRRCKTFEINNRAELKLSTTEMSTSAARTYYFIPGSELELAATITRMLKIIQASCLSESFILVAPLGLLCH